MNAVLSFFAFFGIIFFAYATFAGVIYLCDKNSNKNKKKSLCDSCKHCIKRVDQKTTYLYYGSNYCPFRYSRSNEINQNFGIIDYCNSYARRNDDVK